MLDKHTIQIIIDNYSKEIKELEESLKTLDNQTAIDLINKELEFLYHKRLDYQIEKMGL